MDKAITEWANDDLKQYYENVPIEELRSFVRVAGLDDYSDLDLVKGYIDNAQSILEVGAGYGRIIEGILTLGHKGSITAIERSKNLYQYLRTQFKENIEILHGDICDYPFKKKFDVILLMWSSISEYPKNQQISIIKRLKELLTQKGVLIIETIDHKSVPKNVTEYNSQTYVVDSLYGVAYGYIPSSEEIASHANEVGFFKIIQIPYKTKIGCSRIMHFLQ